MRRQDAALLPESGLRTLLVPEAAQAQTEAPKYEVTVPKALVQELAAYFDVRAKIGRTASPVR